MQPDRSSPALDVLVLEPWFGGSHATFLEQWRARSAHRLDLRGLPARDFRWRMRSCAWRFAQDLGDRETLPDVLFVSSFVDLPALYGFLSPSWGRVPALLYFHENQLTYPRRDGAGDGERDLHLAFTQILSCLRARSIVFNSRFHREDFTSAARTFLRRLPNGAPRGEFQRAAEERMTVIAPGVDLDGVPLGSGGAAGTPLRVLYNQRWEWDKAPERFLGVCRELRARGAPFRLCLLGEAASSPPADLAALVDHCGFLGDRAEYAAQVGKCDAVVSTAVHEFFGLAAAEALAAGCTPLLPERLAYPELLGGGTTAYRDENELLERLLALAHRPETARDPATRAAHRALAVRYSAAASAAALDAECARMVRSR